MSIDRRMGARPNPTPSVRALVRWGLTTEQRVALARWDMIVINTLIAAGYSDRTIADAIIYAKEITK